MSKGSWLDNHYLACQPEYEAMLRSVYIQAGWHVLDAGCGSGSFLPLMVNLVGANGRISAIDLAPENVAAAESLVKSSEFPCPVEIRVGSVIKLPYEDDAFDAVWNANVSQYLTNEELQTMLAEFHRVVKPGGLVAVKESEITALQLQPTPPTLIWHWIEEAVRHRDTQVIGSLRSIGLPGWFREAGFINIRRKTTVTERYAPLRPVEREFFGSLIEWLADKAQTMALPPQDVEIWHRLGVKSPDHILNHPDFYWREEHILVVGQVP